MKHCVGNGHILTSLLVLRWSMSGQSCGVHIAAVVVVLCSVVHCHIDWAKTRKSIPPCRKEWLIIRPDLVQSSSGYTLISSRSLWETGYVLTLLTTFCWAALVWASDRAFVGQVTSFTACFQIWLPYLINVAFLIFINLELDTCISVPVVKVLTAYHMVTLLTACVKRFWKSHRQLLAGCP